MCEEIKLGIIKAICISEKRGTVKKPVNQAEIIENFGIKGDAHAGDWHRQVSMLAYESIVSFKDRGAEVNDGDFGENLIVEGFNLSKLAIGTRFQCGEVVLELTQIGKECHNGCEIFKKMGDCIMPREGVFTRVISGGMIKPGIEIVIQENTNL